MKINKLLPIIIMLLLSMTLASCAGIGDGGVRDGSPSSGEGSSGGAISADRMPTVNDGEELKAFISRVYAEGEEGNMRLANGGTWLLYEYFTEAEYESAESRDRTDNEKACVSIAFERSEYGKDSFSSLCSFKVEEDDYVVYTYAEGDSNISLYGFLPGAYEKLNGAFGDAMAYYERNAGFAFDSILISSKSGKIFTPASFPEIDCTEVKHLFDADDGTKWWTVSVDSVTEQEIVDALEKLKSRDDISSAQHNFIYTLD